MFFGISFKNFVALLARFVVELVRDFARNRFDITAAEQTGKSRIRTIAKVVAEKREKNRRENEQIEEKPNDDFRKK